MKISRPRRRHLLRCALMLQARSGIVEINSHLTDRLSLMQALNRRTWVVTGIRAEVLALTAPGSKRGA